MKQQTKNKEPKQKKKMSKSAIMLIVGLIIIAIPCFTFGFILLSASMKTGTPIVGSRYDNDLDPAIEKTQITTIENEIKALSQVENCEITLFTSQLRVNVDVKDSMTKDEVEALTNDIYSIVNKTLSVSVYFTAGTSEKMYDLAIDVYNYLSRDDNWIYYELTKNSQMSVPQVQCLSSARNEELAKELRGETDMTDDVQDPEGSEGEDNANE